MSYPKNHTGKVFGCLTAISKAQSFVTKAGGRIAVWNVRCSCGHAFTMRAQGLTSRRHVRCSSNTCSNAYAAPVAVNCRICGVTYTIQKRSRDVSTARSCRRCAAMHATSAVVGRPSHRRIPNGGGGFNLLYGRYRKNAKDACRAFDLSRERFAVLTKSECHYCGIPPSQKIASRKGSAEPYVYSGIDRLDPALGYVKDNVVPCCHKCNYMKSDLTVSEFFARVAAIHARSGRRVFIP
jgi:hypothetical protein